MNHCYFTDYTVCVSDVCVLMQTVINCHAVARSVRERCYVRLAPVLLHRELCLLLCHQHRQQPCSTSLYSRDGGRKKYGDVISVSLPPPLFLPLSQPLWENVVNVIFFFLMPELFEVGPSDTSRRSLAHVHAASVQVPPLCFF